MDRVLQFGTGRFLRGFVDAFVDETESSGRAPGRPPAGRVTVVETTGSGRAARLAARGYAFRLHTRGLECGDVIDTSRTIHVIDRTVDASERMDAVLEAALDAEVTSIVSNTTEQGYMPGGYPRLLARVLASRARARRPGLVILPCELIERNGDRLRDLVADELAFAGEGPAIVRAVLHANSWASTMVDRIVTSAPLSPETEFDVVVEPFASWVIEVPGDVAVMEHPRVTRTRNVAPFALRKIRILNAAHTALVARTRDLPYEFVREALADPDIGTWLEGLMREEIVPALGDRIEDGQGFASSVLERLRNPYLDHRLGDIAAAHEQKVRLRLLPTYEDHIRRFGTAPRELTRILVREGMVG